MLKNKGARVLGNHPFQHRFCATDGNSNEVVISPVFNLP